MIPHCEVDSDYVRANVDLGHLNVCGEGTEALSNLEGLVIHAHISDNDGHADTNGLIGTGTTPIRAYIEALEDYGIDRAARSYGVEPVAAIEVGSLSTGLEGLAGDTQDPDEIARRCVSYLLREVPTLEIDA